MLQILTGKFFVTQDVHITHQRAALYANYSIFYPIETVSGTLLRTDVQGDIGVLVYEVDQKMEKSNTGSFGLVAVNVDPLAQDFAAVTSFALRITCSPDIDLVRRLTQAQHAPLGVSKLPRAYISRFFDKTVAYSPNDPDMLREFVRDLIGLERRTYTRVIRAIRRYTTGLHRVADDLTLAYTLLVASIESLAQEFDQFQPSWDDYAQEKRQAIDKVLEGASNVIVERVRDAILAQEHVSLSRRFQEFALAHILPSFYREEAENIQNPVRGHDLSLCLGRAYQFRSKAVHTLIELPRQMTLGVWPDETYLIDGKPALTLQGLARVAHHVILNFVRSARKIDCETIDWRSELPNIVTLRLAEQHWIWQHQGYDHRSARQYLGGFLNQLAAVLLQRPDAGLTDIDQVLAAIEQQIRGLGNTQQRLPMLALYILFHAFSSPDHHRPNASSILDRFEKDLGSPSIESMVVHVALGGETGWTADQFAEVRTAYLKQRYQKQGLLLPQLFETAMTLTLAELYRAAGNEHKARKLLIEAVENAPGNRHLLEFERSCAVTLHPIQWNAILLPQPAEVSDSTEEVNTNGSEVDADWQI